MCIVYVVYTCIQYIHHETARTVRKIFLTTGFTSHYFAVLVPNFFYCFFVRRNLTMHLFFSKCADSLVVKFPEFSSCILFLLERRANFLRKCSGDIPRFFKISPKIKKKYLIIFTDFEFSGISQKSVDNNLQRFNEIHRIWIENNSKNTAGIFRNSAEILQKDRINVFWTI